MILFFVGLILGLIIGGFLGFAYLAEKVTRGFFGG